jgi:hypothetical protein
VWDIHLKRWHNIFFKLKGNTGSALPNYYKDELFSAVAEWLSNPVINPATTITADPYSNNFLFFKTGDRSVAPVKTIGSLSATLLVAASFDLPGSK